eukprot:630569-Ditylum_brightwellii.AAC.1
MTHTTMCHQMTLHLLNQQEDTHSKQVTRLAWQKPREINKNNKMRIPQYLREHLRYTTAPQIMICPV